MSCICHCALLSISVSWTRSPFMALMFAVMLFVNASVCLLMLGFEFLALVNMLVYVGALAVLFLFVIMLLEIPAAELRAYYRGWSPLALFGGLGIMKSYFGQIGGSWTSLVDSAGSTTLGQGGFAGVAGLMPTLESLTYVGHAFYVTYADLLILNSLILTIALFGALVLANTAN